MRQGRPKAKALGYLRGKGKCNSSSQLKAVMWRGVDLY
jgi:hypothetical protein